jgi:hypothetical protein
MLAPRRARAGGFVGKVAAVDRLWEIATAHALVRAVGEDRLQAIIAEAFAGTEFNLHAAGAVA